jgi:iron-sulfur cluster repair protein YtfE (RIC family)
MTTKVAHPKNQITIKVRKAEDAEWVTTRFVDIPGLTVKTIPSPPRKETPMSASLFSQDTAVHHVLRQRPRLAEHLAAFGAEPWERPQATLLELFRNRDTLKKFIEMAASLPVPEESAPHESWHDRPASHLADHLTHNHRDFFNVTLPDIAGLFRDWDSLDPEITELRDDFDRFIAAMRREIEHEETLFFPRVLRYDACLRDPRVNPEFNGGSLRVAVAYRKSHVVGLNPDQLERIINRLIETHAYQDGNAWAEMLTARLTDFKRQFEEHERLEADVLYPMALEMETALYNLSIAGVKTPVNLGVGV